MTEEAFVLFVRKNALQVLVPKFGLEGTVFMNKQGETHLVFNEDVSEGFSASSYPAPLGCYLFEYFHMVNA